MESFMFFVTLAILAVASSFASACDSTSLEDFCVVTAEPEKAVFVNGKSCKNPNGTEAEDFFYSGLNIPKDTNNANGVNITGFHTLGISFARLDYAPNGGLNPPHIHPRATEILLVIEGTLLVGFVTANPNQLYTKILYPGDAFVFPIGLIHFQFNIAKTKGVAFAGLSSKKPDIITIGNAVFGPNPPINPDVLAKAFMLEPDVVKDLQNKFAMPTRQSY